MIRLASHIAIILVINVLHGCKKKQELCCVQIPNPAGTYVYQIPDSILTKMSTATLIQSLLDNPNLPLMNIYNNVFQGRDFVLKRLNASYELNKRQDACQELFHRYIQMTPCCYPDKAPCLNKVTTLKAGTNMKQF